MKSRRWDRVTPCGTPFVGLHRCVNQSGDRVVSFDIIVLAVVYETPALNGGLTIICEHPVVASSAITPVNGRRKANKAAVLFIVIMMLGSILTGALIFFDFCFCFFRIIQFAFDWPKKSERPRRQIIRKIEFE